MAKRTFHQTFDIRVLVRHLARQHGPLAAGFLHSNGQTMTRIEAIDSLMDSLSQGKNVLPCGLPCVGFDYSAAGCPGHDAPEAIH